MKRGTRIYYTPEQKAIIWDRYKQADSLHDIARMFDRYPAAAAVQRGGISSPDRADGFAGKPANTAEDL
ncbi:hypothetical protein A6858_00505 [Salmonella enterica]|nr:hypothetical protein [Salmonella enterica]EBW8694083.1 hypothetical protein [Salmonella enterica subsp. diarizonae serovar 16:z10:e,n,x,z15]